jgi:hypothetical protein
VEVAAARAWTSDSPHPQASSPMQRAVAVAGLPAPHRTTSPSHPHDLPPNPQASRATTVSVRAQKGSPKVGHQMPVVAG